MIKTGERVSKETRLAPFGVSSDGVRLQSAGGRRALLCGIAGLLTLLAGVAAPVSLDGPDGAAGVKSAYAQGVGGGGVGGGGGGGGGAGGGGGIGGGSDGKRPFPGGNFGGDGDNDDDDDDDDNGGGSGGSSGGSSGGNSSGGPSGSSGGGASTAGENRGGGGASADVASAASFDAIQAIEGAPAGSLPTIQEIFALPDDAVLSSADEMRFISQGWGKPAE